MKFNFNICLKNLIFLYTILNFCYDLFVNTIKIQDGSYSLDTLELNTNEKFTEKSSEQKTLKLKNKINIRNANKIKLSEQKFNNFTKDIENSIINLQFYRKFIEDALSSLEKIPSNSQNEKPLYDIIETNKNNLIVEKSIY